MQMNLESDYAIRIVYTVAIATSRIDAKTISERSAVSLRFSLKILRKLVMNNLVKSFVGANGGYELAKNPSEITLYDVIRAIDGDYYFNRCINEEYTCSRMGESRCKFNRVFDEITKDTITKLKSYTMDMFLDTK